jgi:hypothetical protein
MGRWAEAFQASLDSRDTADTVDTSSGEPAAVRPCGSSVNSVTRQERAEPREIGLPRDLVSTESAVSCPAKSGAEAGAPGVTAPQASAVGIWCERHGGEALEDYEPPPPPPDWPAGRAPPTEYNRQIEDGYRRAALRRPPSWWWAEAGRPTAGAICSCCGGQRWWSALADQRGWCCRTCHPPDHLPANSVQEVRT